MITNPLTGAHYLLKGFRLITKPSVRKYVMIPLSINIIFFTALIWWGMSGKYGKPIWPLIDVGRNWHGYATGSPRPAIQVMRCAVGTGRWDIDAPSPKKGWCHFLRLWKISMIKG